MKDVSHLPDADLRVFDRPAVPSPNALNDIYLIGICGTGMGALAGLFRHAGCTVRGSDEAAYPPMSTHLADLGITVHEGYDAAHLRPPPDLTIVGNACTPTHPEAAYAREQGLVQQSFPEALAHYFLPARRSIVVAGTHGKTTTTGLLVHVLQAADIDPGFLVGGIMQNTGKSYALGSSLPFVVEGDEYDSAYFDKQPKFMHYAPDRAIVTSMEFDHADIYADWDDYQRAFERFVGTLDAKDGLLALCGDDPAVAALAEHTDARVRTYGLDPSNDVSATDARAENNGQRFTLTMGGLPLGDMFLPMFGTHNLQNALSVCLLALSEGCSPSEIADGLATFQGMRRRQEMRGTAGGVTVIDDFAHHPTAVRATLDAIRQRYPDQRITAVFEPRSNTSRRKAFEAPYSEAFDDADRVFISAPPIRHNDEADRMLDAETVVRTISERGTPATVHPDVDALLPVLLDELEAGDVALIMSNGGFDGIHKRLLNALETTSTPEQAS
jgi:UDP-N-acetylmuramate: L-alanyl-gamma-D-glutamyl-meso-diaminopimelate ligase